MCDHTHKFYDFVAALPSVAAGRGETDSAARAAAGGPSAYLESDQKDCDAQSNHLKNQPVEPYFEIASVGCRSWFCPSCCTGRGLALRKRLLSVLATFKGLMMWTFTVDPTLFPSPLDAYQYVREKRCIAVMMRKLARRNYLHTARYFYVVEWQERTQMAHFHVLMDASFIEFDAVRDIWNAFRPADAGPVQGARPGFGSIRFTKGDFRDHQHAANYACAYLIKFPKEGYPDWVLDMLTTRGGKSQVHRYSTSRGFWPAGDDVPDDDATDADLDDVLTDAPDDDADADEGQDETEDDGSTDSTIRERIARCGEKSVVLKVGQCVDEETGEVVTRREFVARLDVSLQLVVAALGFDATEKRRRYELTLLEVRQAVQTFAVPTSVGNISAYAGRQQH